MDSLDISSSEKFNSDSMDADENDLGYDYMDNDGDDDDDYFEDEEDDDDGNDDGYDLSFDAQFDDKDLPPGVEAIVPWLRMADDSKLGASSSTFQPSSSKQFEGKDDEIFKKFRDFKYFDTVNDYSDHYFNSSNKVSKISQFFHYIARSSKDNSQGGSLTKVSSENEFYCIPLPLLSNVQFILAE